jgi:hypothetical protein
MKVDQAWNQLDILLSPGQATSSTISSQRPDPGTTLSSHRNNGMDIFVSGSSRRTIRVILAAKDFSLTIFHPFGTSCLKEPSS